MNSKKSKPVYFNAENFVQMFLQATGMDKAAPEVIEELSFQIAQILSDRVTATVVSSLGDREMELLERILIDHDELDKIDALSIITPSVPGLEQRILKAVSDLYEEMVDNVNLIDKSLAKNK